MGKYQRQLTLTLTISKTEAKTIWGYISAVKIASKWEISTVNVKKNKKNRWISNHLLELSIHQLQYQL